VDSTTVDANCYEYQLVATDNVGNVATLVSPSQVEVDRTAPTGTIAAAPVGPVGGNAVSLTGTSADAASGVQKVDLTFSGPASGAVCHSPASPTAWTCTWDTTVGVPDGTYTLTLTVTDNAGNTGTATRTIAVDNTPPVISFKDFVENTNSQFTYWSGTGSTLFYNPGQSASFTVHMNATDAGSGVNRVDFPNLGSNWSPAGFSDTSAGPVYGANYTYTAGPTAPGNQLATAWDNVGYSATAGFTLTPDAAPPTGGTVTTPNVITSSTTASIAFTNGSDPAGGSGLGTTQLQRRVGTYTAGACAGYGPWTNIGSANPTSPFSDSTLADGNCYQYQLEAWDNVNNQATYTDPTDEVKVDLTAPSGTISGTPAGPLAGTGTISGTAADSSSGVAQVKLDYSGPAAANICTVTVTPTTWSCPWNTTALADGTYTLTATITDFAGNSGTVTRTIVVDNNPPVRSFKDFVEVTNGQYMYENNAAAQLWYNPAQSGSFTARVNATDAGSGMNRVDFPDLDGAATLWTPNGGSTDAVGSSGVWSGTYSWSAGAASPGVQNAVASDNAANSGTVPFTVTADAAAPTGGSVSYTNNIINATTTPVTFVNGSDPAGGSGLGNMQLQRAVGTYTGGACVGYSPFADIGPANPTSPYSDATLVDGNCYKYRYEVWDNVNNLTIYTDASSSEVKVDTTAPTGTINAAPASPWSGTEALAGTSADSGSGVKQISLDYSGPGTGNICVVAGSSSPWGCNWDTTTASDGTYTITLTVTDQAGNTGTATRTVLVDNTPPTITFNSYAAGSNAQYQHATGSNMFFNPAQSGSFTLKMNASDSGSGVNRVDFPDVDGAGTLWTPPGGTDSTGAGGVYSLTYSWGAGAIATGPQNATATDNAGKSATAGFQFTPDSTAPSGGTIVVSNAITTGSTTNVAFTASTDGAGSPWARPSCSGAWAPTPPARARHTRHGATSAPPTRRARTPTARLRTAAATSTSSRCGTTSTTRSSTRTRRTR
jgi:hypothetical protein